MELTALADIKPFKSEWRIQVKVLHTWKHYTKLSGETLEIILSDAHKSHNLASLSSIIFSSFLTKRYIQFYYLNRCNWLFWREQKFLRPVKRHTLISLQRKYLLERGETLKISPSMAPVFPTGLPIINTRSISSMELISLCQLCKTTACFSVWLISRLFNRE